MIILNKVFLYSKTLILRLLIFLFGIGLKDHGIADALPYRNEYGDGYGVEWVYFPDGDGWPHFVNLTISEEDLAFIQSTDHRAEMQLEYKLYIRNNAEEYITLDNSGKLLNGSILDANLFKKPIKMFTHGWRSTIDKSASSIFRRAYFEMQDINYISVDWSRVSNNFYVIVAFQTREVGTKVAEFLNSLNKLYNVSGDQIHLLGHSLGAHVMGVAGEASKLNIRRITGFDPALPIFKDFLYSNSNILEASDAKYVDIIHTCGGLLGFMDPIGTADFYPNGGVALQPGCEATIQNLLEVCSHSRSYQFFIESIKRPKAFPTYKCNYWTTDFEQRCTRLGYMGESANATGYFFLHTNAREPFGRGV